MKKLTTIALGLLAGAALFGVAQGQTPAAYGTLINGAQGMNNFIQDGNANWRDMDGAIGANRGNGFLVTKESYGDFRIVAEIWTDGPANSGIFIRCAGAADDIGANSCYEVNVFDTRPGQEYATGGIVNTARVIGGPHRAADKWNTMEIIAKGPQLTVMFNGVKTAEATDNRHPRGRIGLQYGTGLVKFRKFEIQPN